MAFIMLRYVHPKPTLISFYHEWILDLSNDFSASIEMIMWFLTSLLLMWCVPLIDLHMLNHPCEPGMNPTWL